MASESTLSLIIKAVDKATGPLRAVAQKIEHIGAPIKKLGKHLKEFGEVSGLMRLGEAFKGVGESVHKVGEKALELGKELALMALEAGFVLFELVKHFIEVGDHLKKTADRVGLTVDSFASLQYAAKLAGISTEEFTTAMDAFNKGLGQAKAGTGKMYAFLKEVSPVLLNQALHAKTNEEALTLMWKAMDKLKDPSKRAAFAAAAFGKSGVKMGALVKDGLPALEATRAKFLELAGSQTEFAENAEKLDDALTEVTTAFGGLGAAIAGEVFPSLVELAAVVRDFLVANRAGLKEWAQETGKAITEWVRGGGIQRLIQGFKDLLATVDPIVQRLGGWPRVLAGIAAVIMAGPLLASLAGLAASFVTLGLAILGTPIGWFIGLIALLAGAAFLVVKNWDTVKAFFQEFFPGFSKDVTDSVDRLMLLVGWISKAVKAWDTFKGGGKEGAAHWIDNTAAGKWLNEKFGSEVPRGENITPDSWAATGSSVQDVTDWKRPTSSPTKIQIDLNNAPRGTRVATDPGDGHEVDLSVGYALAGGG